MGDVVFKQPLQHILCLALLALGHRIAVDIGKHERAQLLERPVHVGRQADLPEFPGGADGVADQGVDPVPVAVAQHIGDVDGDIVVGENARPDGVVNVVVDVGDLVGATHGLPLQRLRPVIPGVTQNAHADFIGQVQPLTVLFQNVHHSQALLIVAERLAKALAQNVLPGVAEGSVSQVMPHGNGFRQIFVQPQRPCDGSSNAADLQCVGHPGAVVVALRLQKHLRLVHQAAEGLGMDNAVNVPLVTGTHILRPGFFKPQTSPALVGEGRQRIQSLMLLPFQFFPHSHGKSLIPCRK